MDYLQLAADLAHIKRRMARVSDIHKITEGGQGEPFALGYLADVKRPANPKELAEAMNVSSARIAAILKHLEDKDFVARRPDPENGRYTIIQLKPSGMHQHKENERRYNERVTRLLKALGPEDAKEYVRLEKKIADFYTEQRQKKEGNI